MIPQPPTINVAIAGGGVAGLTAAIALLKHPHLAITIYEQASALRTVGASIGLGPNGLRTLEKLGVTNALSDDVCFRYEDHPWPMIYRHWKTGEVIDYDVHRTVKEKKHFTARFLRADLQQALLEHVPKEIIKLGKKIVGVKAQANMGVEVFFADGTEVKADILLGADGIHSNVRKTFVPEHKLQWTGWVAMRSVFDASLVEGIDVPADAAHWIGHERTFFHSRLGKNQFTIVGGFNADPADPDAPYRDAKWNGEGDKAVLSSYYQEWHPSIRAMIAASPYTRLYPNVAGASLQHFTFGNCVALLGDAAHTHGGGFAAGGSLAIEDAYCFSLALRQYFPYDAKVKPTAKQLSNVLSLYEDARKPHVDRLLALVHGGAEDQGDKMRRAARETEEELERRVRGRIDPSWISEHDVEKYFWDVVRRREEGRVELKEAARAVL